MQPALAHSRWLSSIARSSFTKGQLLASMNKQEFAAAIAYEA